MNILNVPNSNSEKSEFFFCQVDFFLLIIDVDDDAFDVKTLKPNHATFVVLSSAYS